MHVHLKVISMSLIDLVRQLFNPDFNDACAYIHKLISCIFELDHVVI